MYLPSYSQVVWLGTAELGTDLCTAPPRADGTTRAPILRVNLGLTLTMRRLAKLEPFFISLSLKTPLLLIYLAVILRMCVLYIHLKDR